MTSKTPLTVSGPEKSARVGYAPAELDQLLAGFASPDIELVFPDHTWAAPTAGSPLGAIVWRPALYSRNGVAWFSPRAWAAHSRKADISALKSAKHRLDPAVLDPAAVEVAEVVRKLCGDAGAVVVNVACGHSKRVDCFGKMLAQRVAGGLGWDFLQVYADRFLSGGSHPKQALNTPALEFVAEPILGRLHVVVDDVATSGWHMEEAVGGLRARGVNAMGVAWISGILVR